MTKAIVYFLLLIIIENMSEEEIMYRLFKCNCFIATV